MNVLLHSFFTEEKNDNGCKGMNNVFRPGSRLREDNELYSLISDNLSASHPTFFRRDLTQT